jgi:hypothetical protein
MENYPEAYQESVENLEFTFEQVGDGLHDVRFDARPEGDPMAAFTLYVFTFKIGRIFILLNIAVVKWLV